jgi:hypothetical protein
MTDAGKKNRERENKRREATAKKWRQHEIRWNKEFGRPIKNPLARTELMQQREMEDKVNG